MAGESTCADRALACESALPSNQPFESSFVDNLDSEFPGLGTRICTNDHSVSFTGNAAGNFTAQGFNACLGLCTGERTEGIGGDKRLPCMPGGLFATFCTADFFVIFLPAFFLATYLVTFLFAAFFFVAFLAAFLLVFNSAT